MTGLGAGLQCRRYMNESTKPKRRPKNLHTILYSVLTLITVYAIAVFVIVPRFGANAQQAQSAKVKTDMKAFENALDTFKIDVGRYPSNEEGLAILSDNSSNLDAWKGPYLQYHPDPWGNDYVYQFPGTVNAQSFDIISAGPDGIINTEDDLSN